MLIGVLLYYSESHKGCCSAECEAVVAKPKEEINAMLRTMRDKKLSFRRSKARLVLHFLGYILTVL